MRLALASAAAAKVSKCGADSRQPQFIDLTSSVMEQMGILAATSMIPEFCILMSYGWLAYCAVRASTRLAVTGGMNRWLARIEGIGLLGCATLVLNFKRNT
jgi:threonine/homoserine/homoserine lactone efflux protein